VWEKHERKRRVVLAGAVEGRPDNNVAASPKRWYLPSQCPPIESGASAIKTTNNKENPRRQTR